MFGATILTLSLCGQTFSSTRGMAAHMQEQILDRYEAGESLPFAPEPPKPAKPLSRARRAAAKELSSRPAPDPVKLAASRLNTARQLIRIGKRDQARGWLNQVVAMDASPATVAEARRLLK